VIHPYFEGFINILTRVIESIKEPRVVGGQMVKLSTLEYASTIVMPTKKDVFGTWMKDRCLGITNPRIDKPSPIDMSCQH
jgi:hypothetical protein